MTNETTRIRIITWNTSGNKDEIIDIVEADSFDSLFPTRKDGKLNATGQELFDQLKSQADSGHEITIRSKVY